MESRYDIIGDIHGQADALIALLVKMGYQRRHQTWHHAERRAIFVGDFVDRGPKQVESIMIVRRMFDAGSALAVMGNHDFNAVAWYLPDPAHREDFLRSHHSPGKGEQNRRQHAEFLREVEGHPALHKELINWLLNLPLWLDLPSVRVIHACWHPHLMEYLAPLLQTGARLTEELMVAASLEPEEEVEEAMPVTSVYRAVEMLIKGMEVSLPHGGQFKDKDGHDRSRARVRWWDTGATTYRNAALLRDDLRDQLPDLPIPSHLSAGHPLDKPTFIGHYSFAGTPRPLTERIACVDYGAGHGGSLCAYRWESEVSLRAEHFCSVRV